MEVGLYRKRFLLGLQTLDVLPSHLRLLLLRWSGIQIASSAFIEAGVTVTPGRLELGADCYVNRGCMVDARGGITIGARTLLGPRVTVLTATHPINAGYPRAGPVIFADVKIGADVWIGSAVTILPGAVIGRGCVVAAGALVRGVLDADTLYAGVPAMKKRDLS